MNLKKEQYLLCIRKKTRAFTEIANLLGKEHPITKMMGSLAWGRHSFETGPQPNLQDAVYAVGALNGMFQIINTWARDNDPDAQNKIIKLYPQGFN